MKHSEITKTPYPWVERGGGGWKGVGDGNGELMFSFKTSLSRLTYLRLDFKIIEKSEMTFPKLLENQCHLDKKSFTQIFNESKNKTTTFRKTSLYLNQIIVCSR